jgi:hypothetical protein
MFFIQVEPDGRADSYAYENLQWHPWQTITERMKQKYFAEHPNTRSYSEGCPTLSENDDGASDYSL